MQHIQKRGIPGVNSDSYHSGYFENASPYRSTPQVHTKFDLLFEALYLFGALVFGVLIVTCTIFAVREYTYSLKRRRRLFSAGSTWSANSAITIPELSNRVVQDILNRQQRNPAYPTLRRNKPEVDAALALSPTSELDETAFTDARETPRQDISHQLEFTPLEVVQNSPNYSSFEDLFSDNDFLKTSNYHKKIYSIKELCQLKPTEYRGRPLTRDESLEISSIERAIKLTTPFKNVFFQSAWTAEKTLTELCLYMTDEMIPRQPLNDTSTKKVAIVRFIAIIANAQTLKNPNIFLSPLNRSLDSLIDSGIIFEILNESNTYVSRSLIEVLLQYCHAHWHFPEAGNNNFIRNQFAKWKMSSPVTQPPHVLFRYLVNLELGIYSADRMDTETLRVLEGKIVILLLHVVDNSHCNDYLGFLPILAQAIDFSERTTSQTLFYNLLHSLVKNHSDCCMDEYLKDDKSDLKAIIQSGFWIKNGYEIRQLTEKIHRIILSKNPQAMVWWKEIDGGRIYLSTSPREIDLKCDTSDIRNNQRTITPGSWVAERRQISNTPV